MSFMYNPYPFDDPRAVNRPELSKEIKDSIIAGGTPTIIKRFASLLEEKAKNKNVAIAFDGYTTAQWKPFLELLSSELNSKGLDFEAIDVNAESMKTGKEIDGIIDPMLEWDTSKDPTLLFGKIFRKGYQGLLDQEKAERYRQHVEQSKNGKGKIIAAFGYGSLIPEFRDLYDIKCFFDVSCALFC